MASAARMARIAALRRRPSVSRSRRTASRATLASASAGRQKAVARGRRPRSPGSSRTGSDGIPRSWPTAHGYRTAPGTVVAIDRSTGSRPRATYRVQLTPDFGFDAAADIADYLADLGVSHLYCSPYLQAAPGSRHGYDVVDHSRVNAELGGEEGRERLSRPLAEHGLGQVLDIVPNHMAIAGRRSRWWWDVLENGPSSRYATYFDVAWDPPERTLRNTILMPVLGDHYGRVLEAGEIRLARDDVRLLVRYHEHEVPIDPRTYDVVLGDGARGLGVRFAALPVLAPEDRAGALRPHLEKEVLLARLRRMDAGLELDARIGLINADVDRLDA